jgi:hypothetical protein
VSRALPPLRRTLVAAASATLLGTGLYTLHSHGHRAQMEAAQAPKTTPRVVVPSNTARVNAAARSDVALPSEDELTLRFLTVRHVIAISCASALAQMMFVMSQVVYRHGARSPIGRLPRETPEQFAATWSAACGSTDSPNGTGPCGSGQLTRTGRWQLKQLGAWLRQRYVTGDGGGGGVLNVSAVEGSNGPAAVDPNPAPASVRGFLPADFQAGEMYMRATSVLRTQQSAAGLLQGLYPGQCPDEASADALLSKVVEVKAQRAPGTNPTSPHNVMDESKRQLNLCSRPISCFFIILFFFLISIAFDLVFAAMYPMWAACDRLRELYWVHRHSPAMSMLESGPRATAIRRRLSKAWNVPETEFGLTWIPLYDSLLSRSYHGIPPPAEAALSQQEQKAVTEYVFDVERYFSHPLLTDTSS